MDGGIMNINGHDNKVDVIQNVIENIDDGLYSNAKDMLNQLKEIEVEGVDSQLEEEESDIDIALNLESERQLGK
jgi:hypothetical protein